MEIPDATLFQAPWFRVVPSVSVSSTSKRENGSSMVHKTGELESAPEFYCPFVEAATGCFAYSFYIVHFSALTIYKHFHLSLVSFLFWGEGLFSIDLIFWKVRTLRTALRFGKNLERE